MVGSPNAATSANISGQVEVLILSIAATQFEGQVNTIIKELENPSKRNACGKNCTLVAICVNLSVHRYYGNSINISNFRPLYNLSAVAYLLLST